MSQAMCGLFYHCRKGKPISLDKTAKLKKHNAQRQRDTSSNKTTIKSSFQVQGPGVQGSGLV